VIVGKLEDEDSKLNPMSFLHPKHEMDVVYLIGNKNVYEMQVIGDDDHCSLFIDDFVSENNDIHLINMIDPYFLLIPPLLKNRKKSNISDKYCLSPLDQLLNGNEMNHILSKLSPKIEALGTICNVKEIDDEIYCVLDDDKVVAFLEKKLKRIESRLKSDTSFRINIDPLHDALAILNEYISPFYFKKICDKYKVSAKRVINPRKRKQSSENNQEENANLKKRKMNENEPNKMNVDFDYNALPFNDRSKPNNQQKQVKATPKSRAISNLSKVNTKGMKSMMSYFSKKKK